MPIVAIVAIAPQKILEAVDFFPESGLLGGGGLEEDEYDDEENGDKGNKQW